mgnify:CR=1 FL=1
MIQGDKMTDYMGQVLNGLGMGSSLLSGSGVNMKFSDIPCEYVVDPNGDCIKIRMKMNMGMNVDGRPQTLTWTEMWESQIQAVLLRSIFQI